MDDLELQISSVKILGDCYLINNSISVNLNSQHRYINLVDQWLGSNTAESVKYEAGSAESVRAKRDGLLNDISWRYERHAREARLGIETTDSLSALDTYAQALAVVPQQEGFPATINWPEVPA